MLPIFRLTSVGGVLLAIIILVLALIPPHGSHAPLAPAGMRGALLQQRDHPEWRQLLILAALQRADEIRRLRDLQDTTETTLQVDIGETSSTELPVTKREERPPPVTPARVKSQNESRNWEPHRKRRVRAPAATAQLGSNALNPNNLANTGAAGANSDHFIGPAYPALPAGAVGPAVTFP